MRALWVAAPLALTRYAAVFLAVVLAIALAAAAAASTPFVRAGVKSATLRGQVKSMSPLAAGLEVRSFGTAPTDRARRAAAVQFGRANGFAAAPVLTSQFSAIVKSNQLEIVVMARTDAAAHVTHLSGRGNGGVWISSVVARTTHLGPGDTLVLSEFTHLLGHAPTARLRIAGVYRALDDDLGNPYWANFIQEIWSGNPDDPPEPTFVLVPERTFTRLAQQFGQGVENVFEFPVDSAHVTYVGARHLESRYAVLERQLHSRTSRVGVGMNCGGARLVGLPATCPAQSSIDAALAIAANQVGAVSATISLLSACALAVALVIAAAAGAFLVRRRNDEVQLLYARGQSPVAFGARTALEALLPALVGLGAGFGGAIAALRLFAPAGTIDSGTLVAGALDAGGAAAVSLAVLTAAALAAFPRAARRDRGRLSRVRALPWELIPLLAAGALLGLVLSGAGLARDSEGHGHPRLAVFLLPILAAAGIAGLAARAARRLVRRRGRNAPVAIFIVLRRVGAARGLLVAVIVSAATAFAAFTYAQTLSGSLARAATEKAYVGNGSDVQGLVDPRARIYDHFPFPAVIVQDDTSDAFVGNGAPVDIIAGDLGAIGRVIRWGPWPDDPRTRLPLLAAARAAPGVLPVIASPTFPNVDSIVDQGAVIPVRVVARAPIPGSEASRPAVLASARVLHAVAALHHVPDPGLGADGYVWAKGDPHIIEPALMRSSIRPIFMTTLAHIRSDPSVIAGERSYRYLRAIGSAAVVLAMLALLLYLQARQRGQRIASALLRRMGLPPRVDVFALALEAAAIAASAVALGAAVAAAAARVVIPHVDPLPDYAPGTSVVYPWPVIAAAGGAAIVLAALFAAVAVMLAARADVAQELRVA